MTTNHSTRPCRLLLWRLPGILLGLVLMGCLGCQPSPSEPTAEPFPGPTKESTDQHVGQTGGTTEDNRHESGADPDPASAPRFPWESWYAYFIDDEHVGFNHLAADLISVEDEPHVRYRMENQLTVRRGSAKLVQHIEQESVERWSGHPVRLDATIQIGEDLTRFRGRMNDGTFLIETIRGGEMTSREIPWQTDFFGPHAVEQSLRDSPLEIGGQRVIKTLMPVQNTVGRAELRAVSREVTELRNGRSRPLLKVENRLQIGENQEMTSFAWIDELGRTIKLAIPGLGLTGYRTNQTAATAAVDPQQDVLSSTFVRLNRRIERASELKRAVYSVRLADEATLETLDLPELPGQTIVRQQDGSLQLTVESGVHRLSSNAWNQPHAADLTPGPLVDYRAPAVQELAETTVPREQDDSKTTALRLTGYVHQYVARKDFTRAFSRASQVAEEAVGDCTEHAVLLAALLRHRQIPARVAAGLVYLDTAEGPVMAYHMWNLAFVDGGWMALDATLGSGLAPANRITVLTSDLASGNEYECLIPVLTVLGQLQVEIVASS